MDQQNGTRRFPRFGFPVWARAMVIAGAYLIRRGQRETAEGHAAVRTKYAEGAR